MKSVYQEVFKTSMESQGKRNVYSVSVSRTPQCWKLDVDVLGTIPASEVLPHDSEGQQVLWGGDLCVLE